MSTPSDREGEVMEGVRSAMAVVFTGLCGCEELECLLSRV
jgi:hypothetical protein